MMVLAASVWVLGRCQPGGLAKAGGFLLDELDDSRAFSAVFSLDEPEDRCAISGSWRCEKCSAFSLGGWRCEKRFAFSLETFSFWFLDSGRCSGKKLSFATPSPRVFNALAAPPSAPAAALASLFTRLLRSSFVSRLWLISPLARSKKVRRSALIARHFFKDMRTTRDSFTSSSGSVPPAFHIAISISM